MSELSYNASSVFTIPQISAGYSTDLGRSAGNRKIRPQCRTDATSELVSEIGHIVATCALLEHKDKRITEWKQLAEIQPHLVTLHHVDLLCDQHRAALLMNETRPGTLSRKYGSYMLTICATLL